METEKIIKNLRLDKSKTALIINAPEEYKAMLEGFIYDAVAVKEKEGNYEFVQVFAKTQAELEKLVKEAEHVGKYDCLFWACYPKKTGKIKSDIQRETVWVALNLIGFDTVTAISIDETWSALRARPAAAVGK
jgi:hypothetical protein